MTLIFVYTYVGAGKPTIKSLIKYRNKLAPYWHILGTQLLQEEYTDKLDVIQANHRNEVDVCFDRMIQYWLEVDVEANWDKLIDALEHINQNTAVANIREDISMGKFFITYNIHLRMYCTYS